jgi:hypothetical protein
MSRWRAGLMVLVVMWPTWLRAQVSQGDGSLAPIWSTADAQVIDVSRLSPMWRVAPRDEPPAMAIAHCNITIRGQDDGDIVAMSGPWFHADDTRAYLGVMHRRHREGGAGMHLHVCDPEAGSVLNIITLPQLGVVRSVSPTGKYVLMGDPHTYRSIAIVSLAEGDEARIAATFRVPSTPLMEQAALIVWALFVNDDHVLVLADRQLVLWRWRDATAVYVVDVPSGGQASLSLDRRHVAWSDRGQTVVLDALRGGVRGVLNHASPGATVQVSPDGTRVAVNRAGQVVALDGSRNRVLCEVLHADTATDVFWWLDNRMILTHAGHLIDSERGMVAWRLTDQNGQSLGGGKALHGRTLLRLTRESHGERVQARLRITGLSWQEAIDAANKADPQTVFAVQPGGAVSLVVDIPGDPDAAGRIRASLVQRLAKHGITVADDRPVTLTATWRRDPPRESEFTFSRGPFTDSVTATVSQQRLRLTFHDADATLWQRSATVGQPGTPVPMRPGQSLQDSLDDLNRAQYDFLEQQPLPPRVPHARFRHGLGSTALPD